MDVQYIIELHAGIKIVKVSFQTNVCIFRKP